MRVAEMSAGQWHQFALVKLEEINKLKRFIIQMQQENTMSLERKEKEKNN